MRSAPKKTYILAYCVCFVYAVYSSHMGHLIADIMDSWENFESRTSYICISIYVFFAIGSYTHSIIVWYLPLLLAIAKTPTTFSGFFLFFVLFDSVAMSHTERERTGDNERVGAFYDGKSNQNFHLVRYA